MNTHFFFSPCFITIESTLDYAVLAVFADWRECKTDLEVKVYATVAPLTIDNVLDCVVEDNELADIEMVESHAAIEE